MLFYSKPLFISKWKASQIKPTSIGDKGKFNDKQGNVASLPLPSLADPLTFGSGGMFDGLTFTRLLISTFGEDNYLKVMMVCISYITKP